VRILDDFRDISAEIEETGGGVFVARLLNGDGTSIASTTDLSIPDASSQFISIKLRKVRDESVQLWVENSLLQEVDYDEFTDSAGNTRFRWGSFRTSDDYTAIVDYVRYSLPGEPLLASTPVKTILPLAFHDDAYASVHVSSNLEHWYPVDISPENSPLPFAGIEAANAGGDVYFRFAFSENSKNLFGYGVGYNDVSGEGPQDFCELEILTAGQTLVEFDDIQYAPGSHSLMVIENGIHLEVDFDYTETDSTSITLLTPAIGGERLMARVLQARYDASLTNELNINCRS
jgi:hypothetical protein